MVEARFGLTKSQIVGAFYVIRPAPGETASQFILRVEYKQSRYNFDAQQCYHTFVHLLDIEDRSRLDLLQELSATVAGGYP